MVEDFDDIALLAKPCFFQGDFEIKVTDPQQQGSGMSQYIQYKVSLKMDGVQTSMKRYSDFAWLHDTLFRKFPGIIIPPIPIKAVMGRFSPEFIEKRRRGLENFLDRVVKHPILSRAPDTKVFVCEQEDELQNLKNIEKTAKKNQTENKGIFGGFFQNLKVGKDRIKTENDVVCDEIELYINSFETALQAVLHNTEILTKRTKDLANSWFEFGLAFTLLGHYETEHQESELGNAFTAVGRTADKLHVLHAQKVEKEVLYFQDSLEDYLLLLASVKETLKTRTAILNHAQSEANLLSSLKSKKGKENEVEEQILRSEKAQLILKKVDTRIIAEMKRFRENKARDFKHFITDFVKLQLEYHQQVQAAWEHILPEIEQL